MTEIWKPVVGYEGLYEVSNLGNVRSLPKYHYKYTRTLHPTVRKSDGRLSVMLTDINKIRRRVTVHRLVGMAFVENKYPERFTEINHKDENPLNNTANNLEWCDRSYNMHYGTLQERLRKCSDSWRKPVEAYKEGYSVVFAGRRCAKRNGFDTSGISHAIKKGIKYKGFYWREVEKCL